MKLNAEFFYNNMFVPAYTKIAEQHGNEIAYTCLDNSTLDFGKQCQHDAGIILVAPTNGLNDLPYIGRPGRTDSYG